LYAEPTCPENRWTAWFDRDNPSGNCDCETLSDLQRENPGKICSNPTSVEARLVSSKEAYNSNQENIIFDPTHGFSCWNNGGSLCDDYEVQFCCPHEGNIIANQF